MTRIFISYRRADSKPHTDLIHEALEPKFGKANVFLDVVDSNVPPGFKFKDIIINYINNCNVVLVVIGPKWVDIREKTNPDRRRLHNPDDTVHIEVRTAIEHYKSGKIKLIPVLVDNADMPDQDALPKELADLVTINAQIIRGKPDFEQDIKKLIRAIHTSKNLKIRRLILITLIGTILGMFIWSASNILKNNPPGIVLSVTHQTGATIDSETPNNSPPNISTQSPITVPTDIILQTTKTVTVHSDASTSIPNPPPKPSLIVPQTLSSSLTPLPSYPSGTHIVENDQWIPITRTFNGVEMVFVPNGCLIVGDLEESNSVCFPAFWLDKFEVTNRQFLDHDGLPLANSSSATLNHPRSNISWFDANLFCRERMMEEDITDGRLPNEYEWEYAARGPSAWLYPWNQGDNFEDRIIYAENAEGHAWPIASKQNGESWVDAYDLMGNVREWVHSLYTGPDDYNFAIITLEPGVKSEFVVRGGSWRTSRSDLSVTRREGLQGDTSLLDDVGFRCYRPYLPQDASILAQS